MRDKSVMSDFSQRIANLSPEKRALLERRLMKRQAGLASAISQRRNDSENKRDSMPKVPTILPEPEQRYLPFPLTDIQQAYWIGRGGTFQLGTVSTHRYMEIESRDLDLKRLGLAWQRLIHRHDMLRAVILPDGQQQILEHVPLYEIEVLDLRGRAPGRAESELEAVRQRMSHQVLPSDQWPLFEIRVSRLDDKGFRIHLSMDALILDAWSRFILFREWAQLYHQPKSDLKPLEISFRDYVLAEVALRDSELYQRSQEYWFRRLSELPPAPELPLAKKPSAVAHARFVRRSGRLGSETWLRLKNRAARANLTPSGVLLAAYAETLKVWSKSPRLTINLTVFNRLPMHSQVNDIVGDFTSLILIRVDHVPEDIFEARAQSLQEQLWDHLEHRYFSGVAVLRELARRKRGASAASMPVVFTSRLSYAQRIVDRDSMRWLGDAVYTITQTPQVWIDHQVAQESGALVFNWDAVAELFPEGMLEAISLIP